jgi:hypothetical protein
MSSARREAARLPHRRAIALAGLWVAVSGAVLFAPGCYGKNCDGVVTTFGQKPGEGKMLDTQTWESNPTNTPWLPFPRQQYYIFEMRSLGGRTPMFVLPFISGQSDGASFTLGGGNLTVVSNQSANRVDVKNDSCSDYFIRLVAVAPPLPPDTDGGGGGTTIDLADAGVTDPDAGDEDGGDGGP